VRYPALFPQIFNVADLLQLVALLFLLGFLQLEGSVVRLLHPRVNFCSLISGASLADTICATACSIALRFPINPSARSFSFLPYFFQNFSGSFSTSPS